MDVNGVKDKAVSIPPPKIEPAEKQPEVKPKAQPQDDAAKVQIAALQPKPQGGEDSREAVAQQNREAASSAETQEALSVNAIA